MFVVRHGPPVLPEQPIVPERLARADIELPNSDMSGIYGQRHPLLRLLDGETLRALHGNVLERADQAHHAIPLDHGHSDRPGPEAGAVAAQHGQLDIPRAALGDAGLDRRPDHVTRLWRIEADGLLDIRHEVVRHTMEPPRLLRPVQPPGVEVQRPAAHAGHGTDAAQQGLASAQGLLVEFARRDVALDGHVALDTAVRAE